MKPKTSEKRLMTSNELNERINKRAQEIYLERGSVPGHDLDNWLDAEKQVKQEIKVERSA